MFVHPLAHVSDSEVESGACVWQFASVIRRARIGSGTIVGAAAIVDGAIVGSNCSIGHGASINPGTLIMSDVFVGPGAVLCNDRWPMTSKDGFPFLELLHEGRVTVLVEAGASIGARAVVLPGVVVGALAMVAAGAVVKRSVPAGHLYRRDNSVKAIDWSKIEPRAPRAA